MRTKTEFAIIVKQTIKYGSHKADIMEAGIMEDVIIRACFSGIVFQSSMGLSH